MCTYARVSDSAEPVNSRPMSTSLESEADRLVGSHGNGLAGPWHHGSPENGDLTSKSEVRGGEFKRQYHLSKRSSDANRITGKTLAKQTNEAPRTPPMVLLFPLLHLGQFNPQTVFRLRCHSSRWDNRPVGIFQLECEHTYEGGDQTPELSFGETLTDTASGPMDEGHHGKVGGCSACVIDLSRVGVDPPLHFELSSIGAP